MGNIHAWKDAFWEEMPAVRRCMLRTDTCCADMHVVGWEGDVDWERCMLGADREAD